MSNQLNKITRNQREAQATQILLYNTHVQQKLDSQQELIYNLLLKIAENLGIEQENAKETQPPEA